MAYRFAVEEGVGRSARRCAAERIDAAIEHLQRDAATTPAEAVHEARKDLKKARSLLRLMRAAMGGKAYRRENVALRDVGRALSPVRDADVMVATVEALAERYPGQVPGTTFEALERRLRVDAMTARSGGNGAGTSPAEALNRVRGRVEGWRLEGGDWSGAAAGFAKAYRRGRKAFASVRAEATDEARHEWRKRVKDLWYQQRLLRDLWRPVLAAEARETHVLSQLLGDDHDLALLSALIVEGEPPAREAPADLDPVVELIDRRRGELLEEATQLGKRVYAEKPKAFARRIGAYVRAVEIERAQGGRARDVESLQGGRVL